MNILNVEESRNIRAGHAHFHWVCLDKTNYISKPYYGSLLEVGKAADQHRENYENHKGKVFIFTCFRKCGK